MKQRIEGSSPKKLTGCILSLGHFIFLFFYLQGAVIGAAIPDSPGEYFLHTSGGETATAEKLSEKAYLPAVFNRVPIKTFPSVSKGILGPEDLIISSLAIDTADRWTMNLNTNDRVTITVAPGKPVDLALSVIDSEGKVLVNQQNLGQTGEVETIVDLSLTSKGMHELLVQTVDGEQTDYALMLMNQESYKFVFRGTFFDNDSRNDLLPEDTDHFWFFNALSGDSLSFEVTPNDNGDPYIELYDPNGSRLLTIDENDDGEAESLKNYPLLDGGMYGIRVAEFNFLPMEYQISLSR